MNERIRELAREAGIKMAHDETLALGYLDTAHKKFAELIVRGCADICINENVSNLDLKVIHESGKFTVQDLATKSCGENLAKRIKEHFGVK
jgi:hypothetical protein